MIFKKRKEERKKENKPLAPIANDTSVSHSELAIKGKELSLYPAFLRGSIVYAMVEGKLFFTKYATQ